MLYKKNIEGLTEWNIPEAPERKPGMSAMLRLKNEAEFIGPCVLSILDLFDEVVCCLQRSTDDTEAILKSINSPKIQIFHYIFDSLPNGPGHDRQPRGSVYERAYFYNWSLAHTTRQWVSKWDGDMVAHDTLKGEVMSLIGSGAYTVICCAGTNLVGDMTRVSKARPATANEPRFFKVTDDTFYFTSRMCEDLHHPDFMGGSGFGSGRSDSPGPRVFKMKDKGYLHFKWCKNEAVSTMAWPENWTEMEHFQTVYSQSQPGRKYTGPVPQALKGRMNGRS